MSHGNVEIVRRMLEAWAAGDAEESLSHYDPNVIWDNRVRQRGIGRASGIEV